MGRKYTKEEITIKLNNCGYELLSDEYPDMRSKVDIIDEDGYVYNVRLDNLLNSDREPEKFRKTNIHSIKNLQHYLDTYSSGTTVLSTTYENAHKLLEFSCGECGETYSANLNHVVSRNQFLCPSCSLVLKGINHRVPQEEIDKEYRMSGLTLLDDSSCLCSDKRKCKDENGNIYYISYTMLKNRNKHGYSTYSRHMSRYESFVRDYLNEHHIDFVQEYSFEDCRSKYKLRFDFAIFDHSGLAYLIEVDGEQHFYPVSFNGEDKEESLRNFKAAKKRDEIKNTFCENNKIQLIRIPYYSVNNGEYKEILDKKLYHLQGIVA